MSSRIKVGIIGAGSERGWARVSHVPALRRSADFEIVAVAGSTLTTAARTAAEIGAALSFAGYEALAVHPEVELVLVSVNVTLHHAAVSAALNAGKTVYCEWPLGRNLAEAQAINALADRMGVRTMIGLQGRFSPAVRYVRDLIVQGYVGRVLGTSIRGCGADPLWYGTLDPAYEIAADIENGNTLLAIPVGHVLDILAFVLGELDAVSATLVAARGEAVRVRDRATVPVTAHDQVALSGRLENGALASVHYHGGEQRGPTFRWEINGTAGDICLTAPRGYANIAALEISGAQGPGPLERLAVPAHYRDAPADLGEAAVNVFAAHARLAAALRGGPAVPGFAHAVRRHALLDTIEMANRTGCRQPRL